MTNDWTAEVALSIYLAMRDDDRAELLQEIKSGLRSPTGQPYDISTDGLLQHTIRSYTDWAKVGVGFLSDTGVLQVSAGGMFQGARIASRYECASMIYRWVRNIYHS